VFWNRNDISNLFHGNGRTDLVELCWETRSQEKIRVVAHSEMVPGSAQYDLLIDGTSFFRLPSRDMVHSKSQVVSPESAPGSIHASDKMEERYSDAASLSDGSEGPNPESPYDSGWRLSMAGFRSGALEREPVDELHSDVYSSLVESLRQEITGHLPQTEGLVSRAIIHAFFPDNDSETSPSDGSFSITERDPGQVEADALCDADEWAKLNLEYAPVPDAEDRVLSYFQKHVEILFSYVRNEELLPDDASRILLNIAAILGLEFDKPLSTGTLVLRGLDKRISKDDFFGILCGYGIVASAAVASKSRSFAHCRFQESDASFRLQTTANNRRLFMGGERITLISLAAMVEARTIKQMQYDAPARVEASESSTEAEPFVYERASQSVPHLMGAMSDDDMMFGSPGIDPLVISRAVSDTRVYDEMKATHQVSPDSVTHLRRESSFFTDHQRGFLGEC
jgi:hypothetical protein